MLDLTRHGHRVHPKSWGSAALASGERTPSADSVAGAIVGLFFGLGFGGFRAKWFASIFGPPGRNEDGE